MTVCEREPARVCCMWPGAYARQMYLSAVASRLRVYQTLRVDDSTLLLYLCPLLAQLQPLRSFAAGPSNAAFLKAVAASSPPAYSPLQHFTPTRLRVCFARARSFSLAFGSKVAFQ